MSEYTEGKVLPVQVEEEMKRSYLDYAMSVIVERALPDVRDGLKPVQRRILYGMSELNLDPDKPHKKSARIVGEVMGKYHPHGDAAIYDAMVRMAQDFSYRYLLVDGHGNFGSVDGDPPAAMRYTEARLSKLALEMLRDLDKDTVDFVPNFDETLEQPAVLPSRFPNLLVNGAAGIAVGMATNIPPHNLGEVIDGLVAMIDDPEVAVKDLMRYVKGPDFPTGALILGREGIKEAYATGRGAVKLRAKSAIETTSAGKTRIVVTELPYMVNKANLIENIAELVREKKIDGISDLRDESDRTGLRVVVELRRDANPHVVLNQLHKHTQMQDSFGVIMLALVNGKPQVLNLREMLQHYLDFQREVVTRRTRFELAKAEERAHILEGLRIALAHLDEVIKTIRQARDDEEAKQGLMTKFGLSEKQAVAILDMRLRRLTALERDKIEAEYQELEKRIDYLRELLADPRKIDAVIRAELLEIKEKYADPRRTQISAAAQEIDVEDLIAEEAIVVTLSNHGYIKRMPADTYRAQHRGGRGITGATTKEEDFVENLFITTTHTHVLFFTNRGKVYHLRGHQIPEASRQARGTAIVNLLQISRGEQVNAVIPVKEFSPGQFLFMATRRGRVKKTPLTEFDSIRAGGLIALSLEEGDELVGVKLTDGKRQILMVTRNGLSIRFSEEDVRPMGRTARGVKGIALTKGDAVEGMDAVRPNADVLVVTENGYGKRTPIDEYREQTRGGKGIKTLKVTEKNGPIVGVKMVRADYDLMLTTAAGIIIRVPVESISLMGRDTQGVRIIKLDQGDRVVAVAQLASREEV
ncbi:MAG: DNA gyrase subunit A [Bacillota bacterium]|nr:DNA gyrase subunit A [Bacillota bacterium]